MATIIQIKRSSGTTAPAELAQGELAYTYGSGTQGNNGDRLFIGTGTETDGVAANIDIVGGKYFTSLTDHAIGTLTASSAILVDGNKAIDELFVGNNAASGGTIKFNEGTNNGAHYVALKAPNSVADNVTFTLPSSFNNGEFLTIDGSGNMSFAAVPSGSFTISDGSTTDTFTTGQTLTFTGGTGIDTTVSDNQITFAIDSTVATASSTHTFTNKTINTASNTITIVEADISDLQSYILADSTDTLSNKTIDSASNTITLDLSEGTLTGTTAEFNTALSDGSFATLAGTETLSNKTLTSPKFADGGFIADANGNELILLQTTTSAVNELEITNAATGNAVQIATSGGDTNIDLKISPKGTGVVDVDTSRITNVVDPSGAQDAATKSYVDSVANGLDVKASVRVATTAALATSTYNNGAGTITADANGALSIDGVTVSVDDRILVKNQASAVQNGLYKVTATGGAGAAFVLTRTPDGDEAIEITGGAFVFVEEGTANADNGYVFTHNGTPTLGSTNITVAQFSGAGQISAGAALSKTGNTLDVEVDDSTIEVSGDALQVKASGIGTNQLADTAVTAGKLATTLDLSGNTITLPSTFVTTTGTQTLTNKTIDASSNTISNITNAMLSGSAAISNANLANSAITISDGSTTQDLDLGNTLTVSSGEGIDATVSATDTLTIAAELATASNKGVASFSADNFLVSTGVVTVTTIDGGTF